MPSHGCLAGADKYELPEVPPSSLSHTLASVYGFSPHVIALGTGFLQRLAARDRWLLSTGLACPDFACFMQVCPPLPVCALPLDHADGELGFRAKLPPAIATRA